MTFNEFKKLLNNSKLLGVDFFFESLGRLNEVYTEGINRQLSTKQFVIYRDLMFIYYNALNKKTIDETKLAILNKICAFINDIEIISTAEFCLLELFLHMYNSLFNEGGLYYEIQG